MIGSTVPHRLMTQLLRVLSHKMRTPLSVISNDLQYLASIHPDAEVERSLGKVKTISDLLSAVQSGLHCEVVPQEVSLCELLTVAGIEYESEVLSLPRVKAGPDFLKILFQELREMTQCRVIGCAELGSYVALECSGEIASEMSRDFDFSLFTQVFNEELQLDSALFPILDSLLIASNISLHGRFAAGKITFQLQFSK